ncbi:MAG: type VI secretion system contractile sheath large subunit [Gammaproteobacteria bacterium]
MSAAACLLDDVVESSALEQDLGARLLVDLEADREASLDERIARIDATLAELDQLFCRQMDAILHAPRFQQLEATWMGLRYLVGDDAGQGGVQIRVLNITKKELIKDFQSALDFDHSTVFRRVYEEEFGTFGGSPYGALIGDFDISRQPADLYLLEQMSHIAAAAHAPFIAAAAPGMFGVERYAELSGPRDLAKVFETADYARWKTFRDTEDARYVGLALPRFLARLPYHPVHGNCPQGFAYTEDVDAGDDAAHLWCNASYAFGVRLTRAFIDYGWCAAIRGAKGGGLVDDLWVDGFHMGGHTVAAKCPVDAVISDRREKELSDLGFISLVFCKGSEYAAFFSAQSAQRVKRYDTEAANANAVLSAQLQYIFAVSRIAHYMKVMMRAKVGSFVCASEVEDYLNRWVTRYVLLDDDASQERKAQFPLRAASVHVSEVAGRPGVYRAVSFLRPHFQLDELSVSLRLVAELLAAIQA